MARRIGRTTLQIRSCPINGRYLWVENRFFYPQSIAMNEGRGDIRFVGPSWLLSEAWQGLWVGDLVIDHAWDILPCGRQMREKLAYLRETIRRQRDVQIG